jgi:hypothetical protein
MKKSRIRELYEQYIGAMEEWQIKLAIARIQQFKLPPDAWDDVMQELAIVVHRFHFDPDKAGAASEETILCRAMDDRIRTLVRSHARRRAHQDRLCQMAHPILDTYLPEDAAADEELAEIVDQLAPLQQEICRGLMRGESILQIAKRTGSAWTTIQYQIHHIRQAFTERGIYPWQA